MDPILILILCAGGAAAYKMGHDDPGTNTHGVLTPARNNMFKAMMRSQKSPDLFRKAADAFEKEGLPVQANLLRERAKSREMPPEEQAKRRAVIGALFSSQDPVQVERGADVCERIGLTRAAGNLRSYAKALRKKAALAAAPPAANDTHPAAKVGT